MSSSALRPCAPAVASVENTTFAPGVDVCVECHATLSPNDSVLFSHPAGGALCQRCARLTPSGRLLPAAARAALRAWTNGERAVLAGDPDVRAHQRLLREFLREHLNDDRPLCAFEMWEEDPLEASAPLVRQATT